MIRILSDDDLDSRTLTIFIDLGKGIEYGIQWIDVKFLV